MTKSKATYPIAENDMFFLWGLMGSLKSSDYTALNTLLKAAGNAQVVQDSAYELFWVNLGRMELANALPSGASTTKHYSLTQKGKEAVSLSQAYLISGHWPHHSAILGPEVVQLLEKYTAEGDIQSTVRLGKLYIKGQGVDKNAAKAFELFTIAADKKDSGGMLQLGLMYLRGDHVKKSLDEGLKWIYASESLGNNEAMLTLYMLHTGTLGIKTDYAKALSYLEKAAQAGHGGAMYDLGLVYSHGKRKPKDNLKAYIFLTLALNYFYNSSQDREKVAKELTPIEWQIGDEIVKMCSQRKEIPSELL